MAPADDTEYTASSERSEADTDMDQRYTDDKVIRKIISPPPLLQKLDKDELYLDTVKNS